MKTRGGKLSGQKTDWSVMGGGFLWDYRRQSINSVCYLGFNVTVLAYGQTGSGKTHTMGTAYRSTMDPELEGVIPRACREIFQQIQDISSTQYIVKVGT